MCRNDMESCFFLQVIFLLGYLKDMCLRIGDSVCRRLTHHSFWNKKRRKQQLKSCRPARRGMARDVRQKNAVIRRHVMIVFCRKFLPHRQRTITDGPSRLFRWIYSGVFADPHDSSSLDEHYESRNFNDDQSLPRNRMNI